MNKNIKTITVNIDIPENEYCNGCDFKTPTINLYSKPECIIFKIPLKYELFDRYVKCDSCKNLCKDED